MYRKEESAPSDPENFKLPFGGSLAIENRWVMMATLVPWSEYEEEYAQNFTPEMGAPAKSFRIAFGALIINEKLGLSDRETVEQIRENPYLQYFLGYSSYSYKAGKPVEFGAKLSVSCFEGYVFLDRIRWDNFNESKDLKAQIENYYRITGYYPESVHVDKIYRTRENRAWCKERGIRLSGPPLGRPPAQVSPEKKKQAQDDEKIRSTIEGKFGVSKRRYGLNRVMAKLASTSQTAIAITFFVMNLSNGLQRLWRVFLCQFLRNLTFWGRQIITTYTSTLKNYSNLSVSRLNNSSILL